MKAKLYAFWGGLSTKQQLIAVGVGLILGMIIGSLFGG